MKIQLTTDDGHSIGATVDEANWVGAAIDAAWAWLQHTGSAAVTAYKGTNPEAERIVTISMEIHDE